MLLESILFPLMTTLLFEPFIVSWPNNWNLKAYVVSLLSNLVLNVTMNIIYISLSYNTTFLILFELFTVAVEFALIHFICKLEVKKTLPYIMIANIASFAISTFLSMFILFSSLVIWLTIIVFAMMTLMLLSLTIVNHYVGKTKQKTV